MAPVAEKIKRLFEAKTALECIKWLYTQAKEKSYGHNDWELALDLLLQRHGKELGDMQLGGGGGDAKIIEVLASLSSKVVALEGRFDELLSAVKSKAADKKVK
jgi:hypothetical protein